MTGVEFLAEFGHRLEIISHDARERYFLFQGLSHSVQRFIIIIVILHNSQLVAVDDNR